MTLSCALLKCNYIGVNCQSYQQNWIWYVCRWSAAVTSSAFLLPNLTVWGRANAQKQQGSLGGVCRDPWGTMEKIQLGVSRTPALDGESLQYCPLWVLISIHKPPGFSSLSIFSIVWWGMGAYPRPNVTARIISSFQRSQTTFSLVVHIHLRSWAALLGSFLDP